MQYHCPRSSDPTPDFWLNADPVAFAADDANLYGDAATAPAPDA